MRKYSTTVTKEEHIMKEIWKEYKPGIRISNLGNVEGTKTNKYNGRKRVGTIPVYLLVWGLFVGERPKGYVIHHVDFDKTNDSLDNLVCITRSEHFSIHLTESWKTRVVSYETKEKLSLMGKGKPKSEEHKQHIGEALKGRDIWNKGIELSEDHKQHIAESLKGRPTPWVEGKHWYNNGKSNARYKTDIEAFAYGYFFKGKITKSR